MSEAPRAPAWLWALLGVHLLSAAGFILTVDGPGLDDTPEPERRRALRGAEAQRRIRTPSYRRARSRQLLLDVPRGPFLSPLPHRAPRTESAS